MKSWIVNRRGFTLCATTGLLLVFLTTTTVFFYPSPLDSRLGGSSSPASSQHSFSNSGPWEIPLAPSHTPQTRPTSPSVADHSSNHWSFDVARDDKNYGLSDEQCLSAFPDFFFEIDRAVEHRRNNNLGNVKPKDVEIAWRKDEILRAMIYDNQLYIIDALWAAHGMDLSRGLALLQSIHRSILAYPGKLPNIEFSMCLSDWPGDPEHLYPMWVLTRQESDKEKWVMPDFGYWSWPSGFMGEYSKVRSEITENEPKWEKKIPKAVWRGATGTNKLRETLVEKTKNKKWADVHSINWADNSTLEQFGLTIPQHCNYQYLLHTEGHSYSGRGKYLLNCHSVSIIHKPDWIEPHTHLFVPSGPQQNMVAMDRDFAKLEISIKELIKNPRRAKEIADNSARTFRDRYLTPAAQACYWRQLIKAWSTVSFEPQLFHEVRNRDGGKRREIRGKAFESFVSELVFAKDS